MEWQPIETAPVDGEQILVFTNDAYKWQAVVYWDDDMGWCESVWDQPLDHEFNGQMGPPTHWMPLPPPPIDARHGRE